MIITCPECQTTYLVTPESLGEKGRNVRCAKCKHVWFCAAPEIQEDLLTKQELKEQVLSYNKADLPAVVKQVSTPKYLKILPPFFTVLTLITFIILHNQSVMGIFPTATNYYSSIGIFNANGLVLRDPYIQKDGNTTRFKATLHNYSDHTIELPFIEIAIANGQRSNMMSYSTRLEGKALEPGEEFIISNHVNNLNSLAKYLRINIGNKLDLMFD
jgi:predicted Zn finger-like uncharacterized protein